MGRIALGLASIRVFQLPPVSIVPPILHTLPNLHVTLTRRTNGEAWEPSKKQCCFGNWTVLDRHHFLSVLNWPVCLVSNSRSCMSGVSTSRQCHVMCRLFNAARAFKRLDNWAVVVRIPVGARDFSPLQSDRNSSGTRPAFFQLDPKGLFAQG
jgi:hypothetical protein